MFLLRCVFWLSVVYSSMSWGGVAVRHHGSFEAATSESAAMVQAVTARAVEEASHYCQDHGERCVKDAALMTALVETTLQSDQSDDSSVQEAAETPLPVPDPRRRVASTMLTRMP